MTSAEDRARRISEIDEELAVLRDELGQSSDEPQDAGDQSVALTAYEEQSAIIENLLAERRRLLDQTRST